MENFIMKKLILLTTFSLSTLCVAQPQPVPYVSAQQIPLTATQLPNFVDNHFLKYGNIIVPLESMYQKHCVHVQTATRFKNQEQCEQFELFLDSFSHTEQKLYTKIIQPIYNDRNLSDEKKRSMIACHVNGYIQIFNSIFMGFNATIKNEDDLQTGATFLKNRLTPNASNTKPKPQKKQLTLFGQPLFPRRK